MASEWHHFEDPEWGTRLQARKKDADFTLTYASDGVERPGKTGDYLVKGHDGLLRIIPEAEFEVRFRRLPDPEEAPRPPAEGEPQTLRANTIETGPKPSPATVEAK